MVLILTLVFGTMVFAPTANAGITGTKCSNSGATITKNGVDYRCKNFAGKLKWQKVAKVKSLKEYNNCLLSYQGGWNNNNDAQTNLNITNYCRKTFHP